MEGSPLWNVGMGDPGVREAVHQAVQMLDAGEELSISEVAKQLNYSRTAIQVRLGSHQQLLDLVWSRLLVTLVQKYLELVERDGAHNSRLELTRMTVRVWASKYPERFEFLINHKPEKINLGLIVEITREVHEIDKADLPKAAYKDLVDASETDGEWIRHFQFRCKFLNEYEGSVPRDIEESLLTTGSKILVEWVNADRPWVDATQS